MRKTRIKSHSEAAPVMPNIQLPQNGFNNQALAQAYTHIPNLPEGQRQRGKGELFLIPLHSTCPRHQQKGHLTDYQKGTSVLRIPRREDIQCPTLWWDCKYHFYCSGHPSLELSASCNVSCTSLQPQDITLSQNPQLTCEQKTLSRMQSCTSLS